MTHFFFDLDGTLGNTLPLCVAAFREAVEPLANRHLSDAEIMDTFGPSEEGTISALIPEHFDEGLACYLDSYARLHARWPEPFPGIREILAYLKQAGAFLGLVTGKGPRSLAITLQCYRLTEVFDVVKTGRPEGPVKEACMEDIFVEYPLQRSEVLYVGDSPYDIKASRACGIRVAAAAWAPTAKLAKLQAMKPDYCFETVEAFFDDVRSNKL